MFFPVSLVSEVFSPRCDRFLPVVTVFDVAVISFLSALPWLTLMVVYSLVFLNFYLFIFFVGDASSFIESVSVILRLFSLSHSSPLPTHSRACSPFRRACVHSRYVCVSLFLWEDCPVQVTFTPLPGVPYPDGTDVTDRVRVNTEVRGESRFIPSPHQTGSSPPSGDGRATRDRKDYWVAKMEVGRGRLTVTSESGSYDLNLPLTFIRSQWRMYGFGCICFCRESWAALLDLWKKEKKGVGNKERKEMKWARRKTLGWQFFSFSCSWIERRHQTSLKARV